MLLQARKYPDKKVTLVFNMSQCGISNMDMEFVKVIINCFKFYFPNMLGVYIYVYIYIYRGRDIGGAGGA